MIRSGRSAIRSTIVTLTLFALAVTGAVTVTSRAAVAAGGVEDSGAGCSVTLPSSLTSNSMLPDPFTRLNGTRISSVSDWTCRREEILQLAEKYIYGAKPPKPASVTGTVSSTNITVNVSNNGKSASWSAGVQLPSTGSGPFPAVIVYGGSGVDTATILSSGAAVINYNPFNVGAEGAARDSDTGAFYTLYGPSNSTGLLMAWAWGVSRIIDVIEQSGGNILKADDTGVSGCSRFGKGAFVAGVFDQRIPLTMPVESGTDGVPILRGVPGESGAQPLGEAFGEQAWVGDAFSQFTSNPNTLPVDTHEMVGMLAPRGVFIMENPHVDWLAARSGSVAALGGAEVFKALGAGNNISYWSDVTDGTHCATRPEWQAPMAASIKAFLENTGAPPAVFRISSLKQGVLSQWRTWTTPTLTSGNPNTVTVTNPGARTGTVGTAVSLQMSATDSAAGQALTWSATGLPAGLAISPSTGLISGTPTTAGNSNVVVTATDGTGASGTAAFTFTISGAAGVTVTNPGNVTGLAGAPFSLQMSATDSAAGQTLIWSATGLPAGLAISPSTGLISGTPTATGNSAVTVKATDNIGAIGSTTFVITITLANSPTVTNPGAQAGTVGTAVSLQMTGTDPNSGQTLTWSAAGLPAGLAISPSTGLISGTPTTAGSSTVTVTAADGTGASGSATFTFTISPAQATGTCHVTYTKNSEWPGGFTAQVVIQNTSTTALSNWSLTFTFPGDQKVTSNFNGGFSQAGENVTLTNASYNGAIAPNSSVTDGFQGSWTSSDASPTSFSLNGTACT